MAGDNRLVTELFLKNNFANKPGITPGTNNTIALDCDTILSRYYTTIVGVTTTGNRCPSQNQIYPYVSTTTTTTTPYVAVSFNMTYTCTGTNGTITINNFTGGSGQYQANTSPQTSIANAFSGTFMDVSSPYNYTGIANGTWYIVVRDKNNTSNGTYQVISFNCTTTTTSTTTTTVYQRQAVQYYGYSSTWKGLAYTNAQNGGWVVQGTIYLDSRDGIAYTTNAGTTKAAQGWYQIYNTSAYEGYELNGLSLYSYYLTAIPTTTTTTTTKPPVSFSISYTCTGGNATITISNFVGGSGVYEANTSPQTSIGNAFSGSFMTVSGSYNYTGIANGTWYVVVRDKNNTNNGTYQVISFNCTTTTTTPAPTTTTTTTTPSVQNPIVINNYSTDVIISGVYVEGTAVFVGSLQPGQSTTVYSSDSGYVTLVVAFSYSNILQNITIEDSAASLQCMDVGNGSPFSGTIYLDANTAYINTSNGSCE